MPKSDTRLTSAMVSLVSSFLIICNYFSLITTKECIKNVAYKDNHTQDDIQNCANIQDNPNLKLIFALSSVAFVINALVPFAMNIKDQETSIELMQRIYPQREGQEVQPDNDIANPNALVAIEEVQSRTNSPISLSQSPSRSPSRVSRTSSVISPGFTPVTSI